ncbi:response regulator transcription factor [Paenibacillus sedimenti]|uniref:Response regulator transcription factor n=1 Tax=Paenibacillus sedimenti TaxID=2770274 RepID=A0A926KTL4_9BACL|nr:response regulator transcription factor [Paenibacillus sedimenti]MBD0383957.1 response regulator transcription factor [Paenibacillus sedimenti]
MRTLRILLADDHPMFRQGVRGVVESADGMEVVGEAASGDEAVRLALELRPDVVLMDIRMPGLNGIEAATRIKAMDGDIQILVLTMFKDDASVITAMKSGAKGYILKDADKEDILRAIRAVASGEAIFSGDVANMMIEFATKPLSRVDKFPELTYREKEVLILLAEGLSNSDISGRLELSLKTVSNYISNILNKLQVTDRTEAIRKVKNTEQPE